MGMLLGIGVALGLRGAARLRSAWTCPPAAWSWPPGRSSWAWPWAWSSPWSPPGSPRAGHPGCRPSPRCATTSPCPRGACGCARIVGGGAHRPGRRRRCSSRSSTRTFPTAWAWPGWGPSRCSWGSSSWRRSSAAPVVGVVGAPIARLGSVGNLAVRNAQRDRRRTAATATAILIGLALVTAIGVLGASTTKSIDCPGRRRGQCGLHRPAHELRALLDRGRGRDRGRYPASRLVSRVRQGAGHSSRGPRSS